jgi:Hypoxia induced protein conserved region
VLTLRITAITTADHYSRAFELSRNPAATYKDETQRLRDQLAQKETTGQKFKEWFRERRYQLVGGSWVASIATAFALVGRNPYLTTQQKIVQARVYAQGFTLLVMAGLAAFEISDKTKGQGRWETVRVIDPDDPEHKRIVEKQIHHEEYEGEDLWRGKA